MAHQLEIQNGEAQIFLVGKSAWHNLGTVLTNAPTREEIAALIHAGTVKVEQVYTSDGKAIDGQFCTRRQEDGSVFGMVSDRYEVLQFSDALAVMDPFVQAGEATYETGGLLRGGSSQWVLLKLNGMSDDVTGTGDIINRYALLSNSHDGKRAVSLGFVDIRVLCGNTEAMALNSKASKLIRVRHSKQMMPTLDAVRLTMDTVRSEFSATMDTYRALAGKGINKDDLKKYVCKVFDASPDDPPRCLAPIVEAFDNGAGASVAGETAWGAYNACTFWLTHEQGRSDEGRLDANMYGTSVMVNQAALQYAYQYAMTGSL